MKSNLAVLSNELAEEESPKERARTEYWAAMPTEEAAAEIMSRVDMYYRSADTLGIQDMWRRSYRLYYGLSENGRFHMSSRVSADGVQGELSAIRLNDYRNLIQHLLVMATGSPPVFDGRAINADYESLGQAELAVMILDYYMKEKQLADIFREATEFGLYMGEGFVHAYWDPSEGEPVAVDPQTGAPVMTGDICFDALSPFDVIKEPYRNPKQLDWMVVRKSVNKHDLRMQYPALAADIERSSQTDQGMLRGVDTMWDNEDDVFKFHFYHRPSSTMPQGRYMVLTSSNAVLYDGPLPYPCIPVVRFAPAPFAGSSFGYTPAFDLMGPQIAANALNSTVLSNQATFGVQSVVVEEGTNVSVTQLAGGLNLIEIPRGAQPPQAMNLTSTPSEVFQYIKDMDQKMETLSGVNSVARGNPEASLKSGAALALVQSMAVQFNSGTQSGVNNMIEGVGTLVIDILKLYAESPRFAAIVGKNKQHMLKQFTRDDLKGVQRVVVESGNAMSRVAAGRYQMAESLLDKGHITPQQFFEVVATGRMEPAYESENAEMLLTRSENETMRTGEVPEVLRLDDHPFHILEHKAVLASPDVRKDPKIVQAVLTHIGIHEQIMADALAATMPVEGEEPPPEEGAPKKPAPKRGGPAASALMGPSPAGTDMPAMPTNPMTGQKAPAPNGV